MSQTPAASTSNSDYQIIFDNALEAYKKKTKKDLRSHPLLAKLETCQSPDVFVDVLREHISESNQSRSDAKLTKWLNPVVNVLSVFSAVIGGGVSLVYSPASVIFTGIGVLLSTSQAVSASEDALANVFGSIENSFIRLETHIEVPPTKEMMDIVVKIITEVLSILGIATKEIKQSRARKFVMKLVGRTGIGDALARLDRLTQEEVRMAAVYTHGADSEVQGVPNKLQGVDDKARDVDDNVDKARGVDDNVDEAQGIDDNVDGGQGVGDNVDKAQGVDDSVDEAQGIDDNVDKAQGVDDKVDEAQGVDDNVDKAQGVDDNVDKVQPAQGVDHKVKDVNDKTGILVDGGDKPRERMQQVADYISDFCL